VTASISESCAGQRCTESGLVVRACVKAATGQCPGRCGGVRPGAVVSSGLLGAASHGEHRGRGEDVRYGSGEEHQETAEWMRGVPQ